MAKELVRTLHSIRTDTQTQTVTRIRLLLGRYYSPGGTFRFASVDPIGVTRGRLLRPQQLNRYTSGNNNPITFIHPTGSESMAWDRLNAAEARLLSGIGGAIIGPLASLRAWRLNSAVRVAEAATISKYGEGSIKPAEGVGRANAFQHQVLACEETQSMGVHLAAEFQDAHEQNSLYQSPRDQAEN